MNNSGSKAVIAERVRCAKIAEIVNDSIKDIGKFAAHILNPNTCIVPLSGGGNALQPEHVFDNLGLCVYCGESSPDENFDPDTRCPHCEQDPPS
jgi:hypothetical protein